jgi:hypothetical protein
VHAAEAELCAIFNERLIHEGKPALIAGWFIAECERCRHTHSPTHVSKIS